MPEPTVADTTSRLIVPRLIVVSNRTAFGTSSHAGGLAVALWDALAATSGIWFGWSGELCEVDQQKIQRVVDSGLDFALIDMTKAEFDAFYLGYANSVLWPVLHNRLDLAVFSSDYFEVYQSVNRRFAAALGDQASEADFIWVHDYHYLLLARFLRDDGWQGPVGFFLHIPFPAPEVFRALPEHESLARGLSAYDVVGLQTENDVVNLRRYLIEDHQAREIDAEQIEVFDRTLRIRHCPIGIDALAFQELAATEEAVGAAGRLSEFLGNRRLVLGVDRMDYSKGLPQRFEAMGKLFDSHPDWHGKISFTQIVPPSRSDVEEYMALRAELDQLSGRINGDYGDLDWIPIRYLARSYQRSELAGLYKIADVCLVTPLQDGMNLVAKEFVAVQNADDPGVLVLSEFAGAAEQLSSALIVNPYDADQVADAVREGLQMSREERIERWQAMYRNVVDEDVVWWRQRFFAGLSAAPAGVVGAG